MVSESNLGTVQKKKKNMEFIFLYEIYLLKQ